MADMPKSPDEMSAELIEEATKPLSQPSTSKTKIERYEGGGITLNVPSAGLLKGGGGLFLFAIFWCTISLLVGSGFLLAGGRGVPLPLFVVGLIVLVFVGIGVAMLLAAINMGISRAAIAVFDGKLMLMTKSLFGTREQEWQAHQIKAVMVGPSGIEVNNRPVLELQIHAQDQKTGLLIGHDEEELYWLADEIRRSLKATSDGTALPTE